MEFIVAAIVVLAILVVLNLLLTFAIVRRMRNAGEQPAGESGTSGRDVLVGRRFPEFATGTGSGRLIGFFSATCEPCIEQATQFARHPAANRTAFVITKGAGAGQTEALITALEVSEPGGSPALVLDPESSATADAVGVRAFPQLLLLDAEGVVMASRHSLGGLPVAAE
ncbi:hypothetical protein [Pseudonocardia sp. GCM10023141]|uniref:hypothetical protein n=1 Tax=Pseudonocardia sp. GCM10023141 TaxID=3252653 RepID=UPI003605EB9B